MKKINFLLAAAIVLVLGAGFAHADDESFVTREFPASTGQRLVLDLETGGSVNITGWSQSGIEVSYRLGGRDGRHCRVEFDENRGGLTVKSVYEGPDGSSSTDIDFEIRVPRWFDIELDSMGLAADGCGVLGMKVTSAGRERADTLGAVLINNKWYLGANN